MCFSTEASFAAGTVLMGIGIITTRKAKTSAQYVLAMIPILFSLQQFTEGMVWLSLLDERFSAYRNVSMYAFLVFAQVVWPILIPISALKLEKNPERRRAIALLFFVGLGFACYLVYCMFAYPVSASVAQYHIRYDLDFRFSTQWYFGLIYFLPTILAPLLSDVGLMRLLGLVDLLSYVIARVFYNGYVVSVWCFLATAISLVVLAIVVQQRRIDAAKRHYYV